jgi:radical SAM protein with 4Fe4S-binding SPASM domain
LDAIERALDEAVSSGFQKVYFAQRDVVQRDDFTSIARMLSARKLEFGFATNGLNLQNRQTVRNLKKLGLRYVEVALHAGTPYAHFLATRENGFTKVLSALRVLVTEGFEVCVVAPVNRFSRGTLKQIVLIVENLPRRPRLRFESADPDLFAGEIVEALEYTRLIRGESDRSEVSGLRLRSTGEFIDVNLSACPYKRGVYLADDPIMHALVRRSDGRFEHMSLDVEAPRESVFMAKNIRSLLYEYTGDKVHRLRLSNECMDCRHLAACHGAFIPDEQPCTDPKALFEESDNPINAINLQNGDLGELIHTLRRHMVSMSDGKRLTIKGRVPILALGDQAPNPEFIPKLSIGLVADLAWIYNLKIADYMLPQHQDGPVWSISWEGVEHSNTLAEKITVFNISSACVANCIMCGMSRLYAGRSIPTPKIIPVLEELKLCGYTTIDSFGGEITLRDDLPELIRAMKSLNFYAMLITTGYRIDKDYLQVLVDAGLDKIEVSLDSPYPEMHDMITGREGLHERAVQAIKTAIANPKIHIEINSVILAENMRELPELHRFIVEDLGVRFHRMFYYTHSPSSIVQKRWLDVDNARLYFSEIYPEILKTKERLDSNLDFCPPIYPDRHKDKESFYKDISEGRYHEPAICHAADHELSITPEGDIYPCVSPTVVYRAPALGRIGETRILDCLKSDAIDVWRKEAGTWPECTNCISRRSG